MTEIIEEAIRAYNLPLTILLGIVLGYWVFVAIGVASADAFDVDLDMDMEGGIDLDADLDLDVDAEIDADTGDLPEAHHGNVLHAVLRFVNAADVPLMVILSILSLSLWSIAVTANHYLNPGHSVLIATGLFAVNFIASIFVTKAVTAPLRPLMRALKKGADNHEPVVGSVGVVKTSEVTERHGQIGIDRDGTDLLLNARVAPGAPAIGKGVSVLVVDEDKENLIYTVKPFSNPELTD
ncbi:MAG: hypothetical protein AAGA58_14050 [Verrucomicrobiota bacterium]